MRNFLLVLFGPLLVVVLAAPATPECLAKPPELFGTKGAKHVVADDEPELISEPSDEAGIPLGPQSSEILWGATSENYRSCDFARAGNPQCLRRVTIPSNTRFYGGYYVGGGTPTQGGGRCVEDGTWGWDYPGILFTKKIALNWTRHGRPQGGTGSYKTDGPKLKHE